MSGELAFAVFCVVALAVSSMALAANVEILQPKQGAQLRGKMAVQVRVTGLGNHTLDRVALQAEAGDRVMLQPDGDGRYAGTLDTTKLRNGRQALLALASVKGCDASRTEVNYEIGWKLGFLTSKGEVEVTVHNPYQYYRGDLHAHTSYSDGCLPPRDAYAFARDRAKLDFFAVTDHSEMLAFEEYEDTIAQAEATNQPGRFVTLYGVESTQYHGHLNFYLSPTPQLAGRLDDLYRQIAARGLLGHFNHPGLTWGDTQEWRDDFEGFHHASEADRAMALCEVKWSVEEGGYIALLDAGWHVGAVGCEDLHEAHWGAGKTWTVVLAKELTRESLLEALWARRTYSTGSRDVQLLFALDGEDMGSQITRNTGSLPFRVEVLDPEPDHVITEIALFANSKIVQMVQPAQASAIWSSTIDLPVGQHYAFARVTQRTGQSWSSPIWVDVHEPAAAADR
jgi:hypothetical protein